MSTNKLKLNHLCYENHCILPKKRSVVGIILICAYMALCSENVNRRVLDGRRSRLRTNFGKEVSSGEWPHNVLIFEWDVASSRYHAFCAGSIIAEKKVLTSAHCLLTNRKSPRHVFHLVRFVAGILTTVAKKTDEELDNKRNHSVQWRSMDHVYSQKFFKFPAFNLAIARLTYPWVFNEYVNKIPYAVRDMDYDGVCTATAVRATRSWSSVKFLYTEEVEMMQRKVCEKVLYRSCRLFLCSSYDNREKHVFSETEGGGLVCYETGDAAEVDNNQGVLVGVTSIINVGLPSLHMRVGLFHEWVTNTCCIMPNSKFLIVICIIVCIKNVIAYYCLFYLTQFRPYFV